MLTMDLIEVGNVSTTSAAPAGFSEDALLLKSISENKISFQQGRSMLRMGESLRRYARRSIGLEIRDYASLSGFLPLTDVQSSFPPCLAPPSYACFATGSLRDFVRSPGDLRALADIFCAGDVVSARSMLDIDNADLLLPPEYTFPATKTPKPTRSVPVAHFPVPKTPKPTRSVPVAGLEKTSASSLNAQKKFLGPGERAEVGAAASLTQSSSLGERGLQRAAASLTQSSSLGERGLQHAGDSTSVLPTSRLSRGGSDDAALSSGDAGSAEDAEAEAEDDGSFEYDGPFRILYELFQSTDRFHQGISSLCRSCSLDEPMPLPSSSRLLALLMSLPVPDLRRCAGQLALTVPSVRWTLDMKTDAAAAIAGKLLSVLAAYSAFVDCNALAADAGGVVARRHPHRVPHHARQPLRWHR